MDAEDHLLTHIDGSVLCLAINNVRKANSMSAKMLEQLQRALDSAYNSDSITVVVLMGNGKYFCTGMDFSADGDSTTELSPELQDQRYNRAVKLFESISACPKTTIALVNGPCYGGGNGLVFACDIRIVVRSATFTLSEVRRGLSAATISRYIVREWGPSLAREAMVTGRTIPASELEALRVVHYLVGDVNEGMQRLSRVLDGLRGCAPRAIAQSKRLVNAVYEENSRDSGELIHEVFKDMTAPSEEASFGISQFRRGIHTVDWLSWYGSRNDPKL